MRGLPKELLAAERSRAKRKLEEREPRPGDVWVTETSVTDSAGGVIEHSRIPVDVIVIETRDGIVEVVPVSYDVDLKGPFDVEIDQSVLARPAMAEVWLRMPVAERVLARQLGEVPAQVLASLREASRKLVDEGGPAMSPEDPRLWFRSDERMRVAFALAATGEEVELPPAPESADDPALRLKRGERPRWKIAPAPPGAVPAGYERVPEPAGVSPSKR